MVIIIIMELLDMIIVLKIHGDRDASAFVLEKLQALTA
jgi:hypothetical protein